MDLAYTYAFSAYLTIIGFITYSFYKKETTEQGFMLGNRSVNYIATAVAAHSSDMSIWIFMAFPGAIYTAGMVKAWVPIGLIMGMFFSWTFIAQKLRTATEKYKSVTLSEYFEHRFADNSGSLRLVSAIFSLFFFIFYISSALVGMGIMFESVFGINYHIGVSIGLCTAVLYTFVGGFAGVAWCDLFQGGFLVSMIVFVPLYAYNTLAGGWTNISNVAQLKNISLLLIPNTGKELVQSLLLALGWGLGYFGQPHILINFMGIKDAKEITKARTIGMIWQFLTLGASLVIGLIGIAFFAQTLANPELIFVAMVQQLFTPFFAGFILCAIIAAGLTTIDTQILVVSSTFARDVYKQYINPQASTKETLCVSRAGIIAIPLLSFGIAYTKSSSVYGLVDFAWSGLGSTFGPVVLTSLYSTRVTKHASLVGMLTGGLTAALWPLSGSTVPAMIPGFFINLGIILLGSRK